MLPIALPHLIVNSELKIARIHDDHDAVLVSREPARRKVPARPLVVLPPVAAGRASPFVAHLHDGRICTDPAAATGGLTPAPSRRRIEAASLPTSYSDLKYYLRCPKDYQFRRVFGFEPSGT